MAHGPIRHHPAADAGAPVLVFGHGAGAGHDHPWIRRVAAGLAARGIAVATFDFPYRAEGRKLPDKGPVLEEAFASAWREVAAGAAGVPLLAGGKSMGGRIASQAAAGGALVPAPAGLVFFGYPLHPPGRPAQRRDRHLPSITAPLCFLHGTRDPFGTPEEMQALVSTLPLATLALFEDGDHSLVARKRQDPDGRLLDRALDVAAAWMLRVTGRGPSSA
ncbi:MAG: alpha/beta family hydrolase [Vicinamibacterales bacterium]